MSKCVSSGLLNFTLQAIGTREWASSLHSHGSLAKLMSEPSLASWTMTESKSSRLGGLGVACRPNARNSVLGGGEEDTGGINLWRPHERVESSRQEPTQLIA